VGTSDPAAFWRTVVALSGSSRQLEAIVQDMRLASLDADTAMVEATGSLAAIAQSRTPELEALFARAAGFPVKLRMTVVQGGPAAEAPAPSAPRIVPADHPLVKRAIAKLGGRITQVTPRPKELDDPDRQAR
jgi:hypothetical protein